MTDRRKLIIDVMQGRWRLELHRVDAYGVRVLILGRLRFVWTWPIADVEDAATA